MTAWHEYIQRDASIPEWPYPIRYDKENEISTDVLILGGGIGGCHAAINAARKGARVVVVERGMTKRSGAGGAGVDHWGNACTNPCSKVTPEEFTASRKGSGPDTYIGAKESWDALLDCESMGMRIRDIDDEFKGADFRDPETKLMFAYNYESRHMLRVWGHNVKPCLHKELKRLGVEIYDRVTVTSLLNEGGKPGGRVVGATGVNVRTGEFHVFRSKATIVSTGGVGRLWVFAPELQGPAVMANLNASGVGLSIGWKAGAEIIGMERSTVKGSSAGLGYIRFGMGNAGNTYHGTPIVDANGKEVCWFNWKGEELNVRDRFRPKKGRKLELTHMEFTLGQLDPDLPEKIRKGEFVLPLYADLTRLPETERRVIFGMMVGNEGTTRIPVYDTLTKAGFDPDKDMLQAPVMSPEDYKAPTYWGGRRMPHLRTIMGAGYFIDWDLRTSLEGLYSAGVGGGHAGAAVAGRYTGRKAAAYAVTAAEPAIDRKQVEAEKARAYAPLKQSKEGVGWKELNAAIARVMQDYCGQYKSEKTLKLGLRLLKELKETEAATAYAANPHELGRMLDCFSLITIGEMVMHASLLRKASNPRQDFYRLDYPEADPLEWKKILPMRLKDGNVEARELPSDYHLKPPYAPTYEENYKLHCGL